MPRDAAVVADGADCATKLNFSQTTMRSDPSPPSTQEPPARTAVLPSHYDIAVFDDTQTHDATPITTTTTTPAIVYADSFIVIGPAGKISYLGCEAVKPDDDEEEEEEDARITHLPGQLLGATLSEIHAESTARVVRRQKEFENLEKNARTTAQTRGKRKREEPQEQQLLVDKYRPHGYLDLTSNEDLNLGVLEWFKSWDKTVFPKPKRAAMGEPTLKKRKPSEEPDLRPEDKILLISGPPGAGMPTTPTTPSSTHTPSPPQAKPPSRPSLQHTADTTPFRSTLAWTALPQA